MAKKRTENKEPGIKKTCLEATVPLANMPYEDQLKLKENESLEQLKNYGNSLRKINFRLKDRVSANQEKFDGLPCVWHGFKASPKTSGYRNKNEFAIGKNATGEKLVGFRLGSYVDGSVEVGAIDDLPHVPERTKLAAKVFEEYIQNSKYDVFSPEFYTGQFRQLTVRLSETTNEIMLIIGIHTKVILVFFFRAEYS